MKKTLVTCAVLVALFAVAGSASAVTCTVDQRPAATLLVPWFQVTFNPDGSPQTTTSPALAPAFDTIVTIGNASAAPTIAHVSVFNERSVLVLDFNIALTGFDIQAMRMSEILRGNLPSTPINTSHASVANDVCQRNTAAAVYPTGFLRVRPLSPTAPEDNTLATALYPVPAFTQGGTFQIATLDSLDTTPDSLGCTASTDGVISGLIHGYITIDMVNYCNLSNPSDPLYYANDAIGMENNLWGEVIFTSSTGIPTYGASTVNIEADRSFSNLANGGQFDQTLTARTRTFYGRYWSPATEVFCTNCGSGVSPTDLAVIAPWDRGFGDEREPLGLKYAARYFEGAGITSNWIVWRASATVAAGAYSATFLKDLTTSQTGTAGACSSVEPIPSLVFFDEDENTTTVTTVPLPSPLPPPAAAINIPRETQRISPSTFPRPSGAIAGWASLEFRNLTTSPNGTVLDQAWVSYDFQGSAAFLSAAAPATQLDPSTCNPLGVPIAAFSTGVNGPVAPVIPGTFTGGGPSGPAGVGPAQNSPL
ncbi:MAG TPA: hypothetical protein VE007_09160 [Thermoanaerobaculia bacterium]|nr:hypothetical protein [Thermoanaerobaculia bacterium]